LSSFCLVKLTSIYEVCQDVENIWNSLCVEP
jgi:hypothetical protein